MWVGLSCLFIIESKSNKYLTGSSIRLYFDWFTGPSMLFWECSRARRGQSNILFADYDQPMDSYAQMPEVFWLGILTKITPTGCMSGIGNTPAEGKCHS